MASRDSTTELWLDTLSNTKTRRANGSTRINSPRRVGMLDSNNTTAGPFSPDLEKNPLAGLISSQQLNILDVNFGSKTIVFYSFADRFFKEYKIDDISDCLRKGCIF